MTKESLFEVLKGLVDLFIQQKANPYCEQYTREQRQQFSDDFKYHLEILEYLGLIIYGNTPTKAGWLTVLNEDKTLLLGLQQSQ